MKKITLFLLFIVGMMTMISCNHDETYADKKNKERDAINEFVSKRGIKVIDEETFLANDSTTNVAENEYVLFAGTGVYMQIVEKGIGNKIAKGESRTVLCRFTEFNIMNDTIQLTNNTMYWSSIVDKMTVTNTSGTFTGIFDTNSSVMVRAYNTTAIPSGWMVPFTYIRVGRPVNENDKIAHVRLIIPHSQGQADATQNVYPCYYDLTFQEGR